MKYLLLFVVGLAPLKALAHSGHHQAEGAEGYTLIHFITSPVHLFGLVVIILVVVAAVNWKSLKERRAAKGRINKMKKNA